MEDRKKHPNRVMVISLDAVGNRDLELMKTLPNFCAFFERAALCSRVESVYPSLTYPAHTSILTGRKPIHHGIVNNTKLQPGRERPDWIYQRKFIKSTTLWDEAAKKGIRTAALLWPVAGRSKIPYCVPEVMVTRKWQTQILVNAMNGPVRYQLELNRRFGHLRDGIRQPALDNFIQASALYTIRKYNPGLFFLHLTDVDTNRHIYGVDHPKAREAIGRHDQRLRELLQALEETGDMDRTTVFLLGDHYQKDADRIAFVNFIFRKEGLIRVKDGKVKEWKAVAKSCDGSCYVYLHPKARKDPAIKTQVEEIVGSLSKREDFGIGRVFSKQEAAALGADPECFLMLEAKDGWYFLDDWKQEQRPVEEEKTHKMRGTHGYLPDADGYGTFFAAAGCGICPGTVERNIHLWDEGVTIAKLAGLSLGKADGRIIRGILL